ncbi:flagellar protein flhE [Erwinia typographi]|uniref:Flagellar protein flhE n=1 Tax=Erwinia typographi TaxID=371042 RepID=A0A0A3ZY56_9GAMM|nr:flagellar protein FlhE [Erwinia typographi]KGT90548.1 flagellar protein flhE [Erwinia typographi]
MKPMLLLLLCLPGLATAASGAWQASATGPGLQNRGMQASSPGLAPAEKVNGSITEVAWRYVLNGPIPSGIRVHLCAETRCVPLDGASGTTRGLSNLMANQSLYFVYGVEGKGRLNRELRVLSNQVMVNYH